MTNMPSSSPNTPDNTPQTEERSRLSALLKAAGLGALVLTADCATTGPKEPANHMEQVPRSGSATYKVEREALKVMGGLRAMSKLGIKSDKRDGYEYKITQIGPLEFKIRYWEKGNDPKKTREVLFRESEEKKVKLSGLRAAIGELKISSTEFDEIYDYEVIRWRGSQYKIRFAAKGKLISAIPKSTPEPRTLDEKTVKHLDLIEMTLQEVVKKYEAIEKKYDNREGFDMFALMIGEFRLNLRILEQDLMMGNAKGTIDLPKNKLRKRAQQDARDAIKGALDESNLLSAEERAKIQERKDIISEQVDEISDAIDEAAESGIDLENIPDMKPQRKRKKRQGRRE